jgi:seryl-tRNA synthetase
MLDIRLIRENPAFIKKNIEIRGCKEKVELVEKILEIDKKRREIKKEIDRLKHEKNIITEKIANLKGEERENEIKKVELLSENIERFENEFEKLNKDFKEIMLKIPNIVDKSVPIGKENVEIRRFGSKPKFNFEPKSHLDILKNFLDAERGAKVAGRGFFYFLNDLVLLDLSLIRYAIDKLIKKGYQLVIPPYMLKREAYEGATDISTFEEQLYKIENEDLYLIATAEHPIAAMFMNETFLAKDLPLKFVGFSPCFRKEVGAHGKYTKGLFRMHQFHKVEQFVFCLPEQSWKIFEEVQRNAEELYEDLGLHYRVVNISSYDLGDMAAKKYDIEIWMADDEFRESGSNSNCTDYQARRLNIKYREKEGQPPKDFVHTINSTAIATSRVMIAIIEQYQQSDGSVKVPNALKPYIKKDFLFRKE